jgi:hypothetical protein
LAPRVGRAHCDAADRGSRPVSRDQQCASGRRIFARQRGQLRVEPLIAQIDRQCRRTRAKQRCRVLQIGDAFGRQNDVRLHHLKFIPEIV